MAVKKDRKISLVVMVITRKYYIYYSWPPATRNKCNIFLVMTITTCDILRSFFTAIKDSPSIRMKKKPISRPLRHTFLLIIPHIHNIIPEGQIDYDV